MIEWTQDMETGIKDIDNQHRKLIGKINELETAVQENRGRAETQKILEFVLFYADWHFKREEDCMHVLQCPFAERNKKQHDYFLKRFNALHQQYYYSNADPEVVNETLDELSKWVEYHILNTDSGLKTCNVKRVSDKTMTE